MTKSEARAQIEIILHDFSELSNALKPVRGENDIVRVPTRLIVLLVDQMLILAAFFRGIVEELPD